MLRMVVIPAFLILSACVVQKELVATGGSRADGVVELSFEIGEFQKAEIDWQAAQSVAIQRCAAWGYPQADSFGGQKRQCQAFTSSGCYLWTVTVTYQCTGKTAG